MPLFGGRSGIGSAFVTKFHVFLTTFPINLGLEGFVVLTLRICNRCELVPGLLIARVFISPPKITNIFPVIGFGGLFHLMLPSLLTKVVCWPCSLASLSVSGC